MNNFQIHKEKIPSRTSHDLKAEEVYSIIASQSQLAKS